MNNMNNTNTSAEIYLVLHCYECDGGFGDAISQETIVTAFSSKDKARAYARKWSKRHVYGAPLDAFMKYKDRVLIQAKPSMAKRQCLSRMQKQSLEQIIVHCDAGYSRSPAVAAALAKALGMSDEVYFSSGQYCPNRHVYRMMMNELAARNFFD